jgi:hypothetical protein
METKFKRGDKVQSPRMLTRAEQDALREDLKQTVEIARQIGNMKPTDTFRLLTEEQAGALIGALVAGLFVYDLIQRVTEWVAR